MSGIVCAIRGGPASRPTIAKSIQLALETGLPLYFLYVVNLEFLSRTSSSRVNRLSKEMHAMGDFILLTAQAQAESQGIKADGIVRHGNVGDEIIALCKERKTDFVVLGKPKGQQDENVFTHDQISKFGQRIERESGAKIVLADMY